MMTIEELQGLAARGVAQWAAAMPEGVTLGAEVPDADAVFFTVVRGDQGMAVQVPADRMRDPQVWESAAALLLDGVQADRLQPLEDGQVPLIKVVLPPRPQDAPPEPAPVDFEVLLPDPDVREVVLAAMDAGEAQLVIRGGQVWYVDPLFGPDVPVEALGYDEELGLIVRQSDI